MATMTLPETPRMLYKARLEPQQGLRFQPTGFPDLGAALFQMPGQDGDVLLVESAQSMANRLELACWDEGEGRLTAPLHGLPYVEVEVLDGDEVIAKTSTVQEAHRLNSPYVLGGVAGGKTFEEVFLAEVKHRADTPVERKALVSAVFKYDPASLLHGIFISNVGDGRMRLSRSLSSFIEAYQVKEVRSGGVKNDKINASGDTAKGFGNVPFARSEFAAEEIYAYFNLDLQQLRSYGLPPEAVELLVLLAQYKIRRLLHGGLRLRTACDLKSVELEGALPELPALEALLPEAIAACAGLFAKPALTRLRFTRTAASAKASKKAAEKSKA